MQTILGFSKSIVEETYDYKNHIKIKICSYLDLDVPRSIPYSEKQA